MESKKCPVSVLPNEKPSTTSKDKLFFDVVNSFNKRSPQYLKLKDKVKKAIKCKKVFEILGDGEPIRDSLIERGWIEKTHSKQVSLATLRNTIKTYSEMRCKVENILQAKMLENVNPTLVWNGKYYWNIDKWDEDSSVIYNKLPLKISYFWVTKHGLCQSLKDSQWNFIEDIAEGSFPRTFTCLNDEEKDDFQDDYKLTACTSLLKWVLSMVANERQIFVESGTVAVNVLVFALNRVKEYLYSKQNKDIDSRSVSPVTKRQWDTFLNKYYNLIERTENFEHDVENKVPLFLEYAKFLLSEIYKYRPQLSCEGCRNIWILKPIECSRGRGIRMASKFGVLTELFDKSRHVVQKYIEEPMLIHETKFDIRQYYLVSRVFPLVIWMYKDCYLKFSSQKYNIKDYHKSIHITNNSIQTHYENCKDRHPDLPEENMWSLNSLKGYLKKIGNDNVWDEITYPEMKKCIIGLMLCSQRSTINCKNRFELFGCDFVVDKCYNPWLIEVNSCPDLRPTTKVTANICPAVLSDLIKVVIDRARNPRASTGDFECIYSQEFPIMPYIKERHHCNDLEVRGHALSLSYFFKGNIEEPRVKCNTILEKSPNIKELLNEIKKTWEPDIMQEPEEVIVEPTHEINSSRPDEEKKAMELTKLLDVLLEYVSSKGLLLDSVLEKLIPKICKHSYKLRQYVASSSKYSYSPFVYFRTKSPTRRELKKPSAASNEKKDVFLPREVKLVCHSEKERATEDVDSLKSASK